MNKFELDISAIIDKVKGREQIAVRKICQELHQGVTLKTPVDTGRARANWNVGINDVARFSHMAPFDVSETLRNAERVLRKLAIGDVIYISNNVDYIEFLEEGSSDQAPNGMVATTLRAMPFIVNKSVQEAKRERP